jgi:hypothetical protein
MRLTKPRSGLPVRSIHSCITPKRATAFRFRQLDPNGDIRQKEINNFRQG